MVRSWRALALTVAAFVVISCGVFLVYPQTYTASAYHTVEPIAVVGSGSSFDTVNMETERVIATSASVLEAAGAKAGVESVDDLAANVTVEVPRTSQVLIVRATADTPADAAAQANAVAEAYGERRVASARAVLEQTEAALDEALAATQAIYDGQPDGSAAREAAGAQLVDMAERRAALSATPVTGGSLVSAAQEPQRSDRPSLVIFLAGGAVLGLFAGFFVALWVTRTRMVADGEAESGERYSGLSGEVRPAVR